MQKTWSTLRESIFANRIRRNFLKKKTQRYRGEKSERNLKSINDQNLDDGECEFVLRDVSNIGRQIISLSLEINSLSFISEKFMN